MQTPFSPLDDAPGLRVIQSSRIAAILKLLEARSSLSIAELAARFDCSEETIRRDIRQLEQTGRVLKVHGGVRTPDADFEAPYRLRFREQAEAKQQIGQAAAELVEPGMTLLVDSGTTCFWLVRALARVPDLTIITNSIDVASEVLGRPKQRLFVAGGVINHDYRAAFGPEAIAYCGGFVPDLTIFSMGAIDAERGFLDFEPDEATFKRALLERARRIVVLADSTKFGRKGTTRVADFADVADLVTEAQPSHAFVAAAAATGMAVHVARAAPAADSPPL